MSHVHHSGELDIPIILSAIIISCSKSVPTTFLGIRLEDVLITDVWGLAEFASDCVVCRAVLLFNALQLVLFVHPPLLFQALLFFFFWGGGGGGAWG